MKANQSKGGSPLHQTVAPKIEFENADQSIQIEFTDQQLSPHAGTATFWSFVHQSGWRELVARCLPHPEPTSNNALSPVTKVAGGGDAGWAVCVPPVAFRRPSNPTIFVPHSNPREGHYLIRAGHLGPADDAGGHEQPVAALGENFSRPTPPAMRKRSTCPW